MQIKFLGTGSAGNAIVIQTESTTIMIDCGIPKTLIEKKLLENDVNPADIDAIFITHEHGDHIKGLNIAYKWNIPMFATEGTLKGIFQNFDRDSFKWCDVIEGEFLGTKSFTAYSFKTHHNTYDSCGYVFQFDTGEKVSFCLDTGHVSPDMIEAVRGSTHYIIESNHDRDMVTLSDYPESVQARNLSDIGHLSNEQAANALSQLVTGNGEQIYLAHLSNKCNTPTLAKMAVINTLAKKGFIGGQHFKLRTV